MRNRAGWIMASAVGAALTGLASAQAEVSRFSGDGHVRDVLREFDGAAVGGLDYVDAKVGKGFHFNGRNTAVNVPDRPELRFTESLTLSAWVRADSYPPREQDYGQIIFRGDDRGGNDPYFLGLRHNGLLVFAVDSGQELADVRAPLPTGRFVHVVASLDDATGLMRLLFDGKVVAQTTTDVRPARDLDPNANPGIGIGNHANQPHSQWRQPFSGVLDEVSLSGETTLKLASVAVKGVGQRLVGEVKLAVPAPPGGAEIQISGGSPGVVLPANVTIPAGETVATFPIPAEQPRSPVSATVKASYNGSMVTNEFSL